MKGAGGSRRGAVVAATVATAVALAVASSLAAQTPPSLERVDSLIADQRTEDARAALVAWMAEKTSRSRVEAQRALWLRGLLTVDPVQAAVDYQRLLVEYPGGPFSDRALLRLAQAAHAQGERTRARSLLTSLLRDYPGSPTRLEAGALLESLEAEPAGPVETAAAVTAESTPAPTPPAAGPTPARRDPPPPETLAAPGAAPPAPTPTGSPAPRWTVQLGAFASPGRAAGLRDEVAAAGIEARIVIVPGSRLLRVRTGRYASQPEAERARERLTARGLDATVAGDGDREEPAP